MRHHVCVPGAGLGRASKSGAGLRRAWTTPGEGLEAWLGKQEYRW